jgi:ATP synthase F1 delta subunit
MFRSENWAIAFVHASKTTLNAEEALQYLKLFCNTALALPGDLFGKNDSDRLEKIIISAKKKYFEKNADNSALHNYTIAERFFQLMVRRYCFQHYKKIIRSTEKIINRQKGIEEVVVESTVDLDMEFMDIMAEKTKKLIGAKEIKLKQRLIPELIGGLRLRHGSMLYDGSIKRALEIMGSELK